MAYAQAVGCRYDRKQHTNQTDHKYWLSFLATIEASAFRCPMSVLDCLTHKSQKAVSLFFYDRPEKRNLHEASYRRYTLVYGSTFWHLAKHEPVYYPAWFAFSFPSSIVFIATIQILTESAYLNIIICGKYGVDKSESQTDWNVFFLVYPRTFERRRRQSSPGLTIPRHAWD